MWQRYSHARSEPRPEDASFFLLALSETCPSTREPAWPPLQETEKLWRTWLRQLKALAGSQPQLTRQLTIEIMRAPAPRAEGSRPSGAYHKLLTHKSWAKKLDAIVLTVYILEWAVIQWKLVDLMSQIFLGGLLGVFKAPNHTALTKTKQIFKAKPQIANLLPT